MVSVSTQTRIIKQEARASKGMVATKDRYATEAGVAMLEAGGNAIDAAVAACFAIGVVEPASSGIGGGGYLVYQVGESGGVVGFPMRGPLAAQPDMYELTGEASKGSFGWAGVENDDNIEGFRSIATPGAVAGLCEAHRRFGKLPLQEVLAPAVSLARNGFSPHWFDLYSIGGLADMLFKYEELRKVMMPGGKLPKGDADGVALLQQPDLADVLEAIGKQGPEAFYKGDVAQRLVQGIQSNGGILSLEDLSQYKPFIWDQGLEFSYRGNTVRVPPYASAGITSAMTLKLLGGFDVASTGHNSEETLHAYISCARLAYADRFSYVADPEYVDVPWKGLLSDSYPERRRASIQGTVPRTVEAGDPWIEEGRSPTKVLEASRPAVDVGTTHLCAMDAEGNAVSLTNTVMSGFGSGIIPKGTGVVMNNGMMWFDPVPGRVNSIMPGRFPLNNMTPALVIGDDGVELALGASGGRRITNCVTQLISKMIDFEMGPQEAIDSPRVDCSNPHTTVGAGIPQDVLRGLESRGHLLRAVSEGTVQNVFVGFASPVAIVRRGKDDFRAGVDTFHSAHAAGL